MGMALLAPATTVLLMAAAGPPTARIVGTLGRLAARTGDELDRANRLSRSPH
jgi:hypothetical protein